MDELIAKYINMIGMKKIGGKDLKVIFKAFGEEVLDIHHELLDEEGRIEDEIEEKRIEDEIAIDDEVNIEKIIEEGENAKLEDPEEV